MALASLLKVNHPHMSSAVYQQVMWIEITVRDTAIGGKCERFSSNGHYRVCKGVFAPQGLEGESLFALYRLKSLNNDLLKHLWCIVERSLIIFSQIKGF